jgi:hypothetical protein
MLRNWVTQFGYAAGRWAGDEQVSPDDRGKFIGQVGSYFGWNPPPGMSWVVEVTKDRNGKHPGKYIVCFMRYTTDDEAERLLGKNYEKTNTNSCQTCECQQCKQRKEFLREQMKAIQKELGEYDASSDTNGETNTTEP